MIRHTGKESESFQGHIPQTRANADVAMTRSCLRCQEKFESSGFGERICRRCKSTSTWRDGNPATSGKR
tara:strand:- start:143 stop:349 length:207 start_codon:yes stop_codon:yes gene_type:complete